MTHKSAYQIEKTNDCQAKAVAPGGRGAFQVDQGFEGVAQICNLRFSGTLNADSGGSTNDGVLLVSRSAAIANVASPIMIRNTGQSLPFRRRSRLRTSGPDSGS
jgi:hypothetical protein